MKFVALLLSLLAAGCASSSRYVAKVNQDEVTGDEAIRVFGRQHMAMEKALGDEQDIRRMLPRVVERRLMVQEAYQLGLDADPGVVEGTARYENEQLAALFRKREVDVTMTATDAEVTAGYDLMQSKNLARQVVVPGRKEAEALRARVVAGESIERIARSDSTAPSTKRGGLIVVQWGAPDVVREKVVFALAEGQVSEVYESGLGWEFDQLEKRGPVEMPPLDEIRSRVEDVIVQRKVKAHREALDAELWRKFDVQLAKCPGTVESLTGALDGAAGQEACATWRGGRLTAREVARRMKPETLAESSPEEVARMVDTRVRDMVTRVLYGYEGASRGWAPLPEVADAVRFKKEDLMEAKLYSDYVFKSVAVTDEEAKAFYEANKGEFTRPASYVLAHVLVETQEEAVKARADAVAGEPFEEIAKKRSRDAATAPKGGLVGFAAEPQLQGPFKAVIPLGEGEMSEAIQSRYGWHVVKVLKKNPAQPLTWDEAAAGAKEQALQQKANVKYAEWVRRLRDQATIELSDAGIEAMSARQLEALRKDESEKKARSDAARAKADAEEARKAASKKKAADAKAAAAAKDGAAAPATAPAPAATPAK